MADGRVDIDAHRMHKCANPRCDFQFACFTPGDECTCRADDDGGEFYCQEACEPDAAPPLVVFYDTETTGLPGPGRAPVCVIELAAQVCDADAAETGRFSTLIRPDVELSEAQTRDAEAFHNITRDMLAHADVPTFAAAWERFIAWLDGERRRAGKTRVLLVAHNNFDFDLRVLEDECTRGGISTTSPEWLHHADSLIALRNQHIHGKGGRYGLKQLVDRWMPSERDRPQQHRAGDDTATLARLLTEGLPYDLARDVMNEMVSHACPPLPARPR